MQFQILRGICCCRVCSERFICNINVAQGSTEVCKCLLERRTKQMSRPSVKRNVQNRRLLEKQCLTGVVHLPSSQAQLCASPPLCFAVVVILDSSPCLLGRCTLQHGHFEVALRWCVISGLVLLGVWSLCKCYWMCDLWVSLNECVISV